MMCMMDSKDEMLESMDAYIYHMMYTSLLHDVHAYVCIYAYTSVAVYIYIT